MSKASEPIRNRRKRRPARSSSDQANAAGSNPAVPLSSARKPSAPVSAAPVSAGPTKDHAGNAPVAAGRRPRRANDAPVDAPGMPSKAGQSTLSLARDSAAVRSYLELAESPSGQSAVLPSRRALRLARLEAERGSPTRVTDMISQTPAAALSGPGTLPADSGGVELSVVAEKSGPPAALAAREALTQDAQHHLDLLPPAVTADPLAVDLEILAQQRAIAERAEVLNGNAQVREGLVQENTKSRPPVNDPTAAHNLAMVTPLEFVRVPGIDRPVMRPPTTSHIPVIARVAQKKRPQGPAPVPGSTPPISETAALSAPQNPAAPDTAVRPVLFEPAEMSPLPAGSAHGLEPLDAVTAGLGRLQRNRLILWGAVAIGGVALIAGFTMIITGLAR